MPGNKDAPQWPKGWVSMETLANAAGITTRTLQSRCHELAKLSKELEKCPTK